MMKATGSVHIEFKPALNQLEKDKELRHGLSAVVKADNTLWVVNDETVTLERFTFQEIDKSNGIYRYGDHTQFPLNVFFRLPSDEAKDKKEKGADAKSKQKIEEADIEGLDVNGGYLWLVGSHSLKRKKPDKTESLEDNFKDLAEVKSDGNRYLLARIPLPDQEATAMLGKATVQSGNNHTTGQLLRVTTTGNALTEALAQDKHLQQFLAIPGKDNGFDIEGLTVGDEGRVFLGLRGPVLRGWAVILELQVEADLENPAELRLKNINLKNASNVTGNPTYRKHFLDLGGLGIRDLCRDGDDLLILAGPTMELDSPVVIYRWKGGIHQKKESLVSGDALQKVPIMSDDQGADRGKDRAEGMTPFASDGGMVRSVLVVYDSPDKNRLVEDSAVKADIFALPA